MLSDKSRARAEQRALTRHARRLWGLERRNGRIGYEL